MNNLTNKQMTPMEPNTDRGATATKSEEASPRLYSKVEKHKVDPCNELLEILVVDEAGSGGAHHVYRVYWPTQWREPVFEGILLQFQKGPIQEHGLNGITQEALLAIVAHRLECFQNGPYACDANASALMHVETALDILKGRTRERRARGVEGTNRK